MLQILPAPTALVDESGAVTQAIFEGPCQRANLEDAPLQWGGLRLPAALTRLRLKQWQHFACILPEVFLGVAVVDAGWMRTSWCHLRERATGSTVEHSRRGLRLDLQVAGDLWEDRCWARAPGYQVEIENQLGRGQHQLRVLTGGAPGQPQLRAELCCQQDLRTNQPLVVCMPVAPGRSMYSHKAVLPLSGEISLGELHFSADPHTCFAILDVHKAHYPRHTFWEWATFSGRDRQGRWLGLNLTRNGNREDQRINENALWLDGRIHHLGPARFEHNRERPLHPWQVGSEDGAVDLTFTPEAARSENLRLGLVRSVFHQLQGQFYGQVRVEEQSLEVEGLFGLCEDHDSLW